MKLFILHVGDHWVAASPHKGTILDLLDVVGRDPVYGKPSLDSDVDRFRRGKPSLDSNVDRSGTPWIYWDWFDMAYATPTVQYVVSEPLCLDRCLGPWAPAPTPTFSTLITTNLPDTLAECAKNLLERVHTEPK